jgi:twitching motility protein PilT
MAVLDRFLNVMFDKDARSVVLETGKQVCLEIDSGQHPVTKDPINTPKILNLVREIMPEGLQPQLDGGEGRLTFGYLLNDHRVDAEIDRVGESVTVVLSPAKPRRSTAAVSVPADALLMESPADTAAHPPAPTLAVEDTDELQPAGQVKAVSGQAEERIQDLLRFLVDSDSSDLHLRVDLPPTVRTHGELKPIPDHTGLIRSDIEEMVLAIMPDRNKQEYADTNDTDFAYEMIDVARFRVNAFRDRKGPAAVFRVIPTDILTVDQLGVSDAVQALCYLTKGLVVVTGPTGSGKSTTLAGMIDLINSTRTDHVLTIEDPIEFVHKNKKCVITQRQVGSHTQSFKRALRAALREDPDIVLIGEMRDLETVAIAIETAETGHLVFGTLHTTTAVSTVDRMIDQFPADQQDQIRVMLSESLRGVISQVLLKKIGGGRVPAREILITNAAVSNLIREGKTFQLTSTIQTNKKAGMITLNDSLLELVDKKVVEPEEAYMKSADKASMEAAMKQRGIQLSFK